jgi:hypothetical protein
MILRYITDNTNDFALCCPVCDSFYRSGAIACDAYVHAGGDTDDWIGRLCEECMVLDDERLKSTMPRIIDRGDGVIIIDPAELEQITREEQPTSCPECKQDFRGVVEMVRHYLTTCDSRRSASHTRERLKRALKRWRKD